MEAARQPGGGATGLVEAGRERRGSTLAAGILATVAGVVAIVTPAVVSVAVDLLIGWVLVGGSAVIVVDAFAKGGAARIAFRGILALATFAAGIYLLVAPLEGTYSLTVILVIWFVASGFTQILIGIAEWRLPGGGLLTLSGVVSLLLGLLIANRLPEAAAWAIGLLVGVQLIFYGISAISAWYSLGRLQRGGDASQRSQATR